jgi:flagellar protein FliS
MDRSTIQSFATRITQAKRTDLVVISYDVILQDVADAKAFYGAEDFVSYDDSLRHAGLFVSSLISTLDLSITLSHDLLALYAYVNKCLIQARFSDAPAVLDYVVTVISGLRVSFEELSLQDTSAPLMQNVQNVYAGLTYGKGMLNEAVFDTGTRGFKA